jgi:hypothetical protein
MLLRRTLRRTYRMSEQFLVIVLSFVIVHSAL